MSLFADIYNTVAKFFRPQEEPQGEASKSVATNRLKLVLMQDRTNLTPKILEQMRSELIDLLSRYVELDKELLDLNFEQEGDQVALMLSIPVIRAKDEEEIEAAIKAHKEALMAEENSEENESEEASEEDDETEENLEEITEEISEEITSEETDESEESDEAEMTEEEKAEAEKTDAIAKELKDVPKIIKKKKVSAPENMGNNPFKSEENEKIESSSEA